MRVVSVMIVAALTDCGDSTPTTPPPPPVSGNSTPKAVCGPGSNPETGIQGRVSRAEHQSGRAAEGYSCNTELVGSRLVPDAIGTVDGENGVNVLDLSDPTQPQLTARQLTLFGRESGLSPDGKTFYVASPGTPTLTAVDISDPEQPRVLKTMPYSSHGLSISADGNRAYLAGVGLAGAACSMIASGLRVFDIRDVRKPREVAYFNAPMQPRLTPYLEASGYAMASPGFVPERKEIWYSDVYSGFYAMKRRLRRDALNGEVTDIGTGTGVLESDGTNITASVQIQYGVLIKVFGISDCAGPELDVERVRVFKVLDFHGLYLRS